MSNQDQGSLLEDQAEKAAHPELKTRSVLPFKTKVLLGKFLCHVDEDQELGGLRHFFATELVDRAAAAVGQPVTVSNIRTVAAAYGLKFKERSKVQPAAALEARVAALEADLAELARIVRSLVRVEVPVCHDANSTYVGDHVDPLCRRLDALIDGKQGGPAGDSVA